MPDRSSGSEPKYTISRHQWKPSRVIACQLIVYLGPGPRRRRNERAGWPRNPPELLHRGGDAGERGDDVLARVERADAEVALAATTEAGAGRNDHLGLVQQQVEEFPRVAAGVDPDVRGGVAADAVQAELGHGVADKRRVAEIEIGERARLFLSLGCVDGGGGFLHGVGNA